MGFRQIIGQQRSIYILGKAFIENRLHHAYRLEGPDGVGKLMTAKATAATINCHSPVPFMISCELGGEMVEAELLDSCGQCSSCKKIFSLDEEGHPVHPDIYILKPQEDSRVVRIDQIRQIHSFIYFPPMEGKKRVIIIDNAENITESAANSFLKILEEPPPSTMFFLITSRPHMLLQTIRSRSCSVGFAPLEVSNIVELLCEIYPDDDKKNLTIAASLSGGSVSRAIQLVERQDVLKDSFKFVLHFGRELIASSNAIENLLDNHSLSRDNVTIILELISLFFRDVATYKATSGKGSLHLKKIKKQLSQASDRYSIAQSTFVSQMALEGFKKLELNVNPRMIIEEIALSFRDEFY